MTSTKMQTTGTMNGNASPAASVAGKQVSTSTGGTYAGNASVWFGPWIRRNEGLQAWCVWMMTRAIVEKLPPLTPDEIEQGSEVADSFRR